MKIFRVKTPNINVKLRYTWKSELAGEHRVFFKYNFNQWSEYIHYNYPNCNYNYHINKLEAYGICNLEHMVNVKSANITIDFTPNNLVSRYLTKIKTDCKTNNNHLYNPWYNFLNNIFNNKDTDYNVGYNKLLIIKALQSIKGVKGYDDCNILNNNIIVSYNNDIWYITENEIFNHNNMLIYDLNKGWSVIDKDFAHLL